jgi:poly-gamma-glutamate synthesis protein (capsule biosynthesis protein)
MKLKLIPVIILCLQYPNAGISQDTTRLSLLFLGDIMQHDSQIKAAYNDATTGRSYDYSDCFRFVKPYIQSVDVAIGNLELTLAGPPFKGYPQFSAPDELALTLKDIGMDVLVTANNHSVDRGKKGIDRTIEMLDSLKIIHTGTFKDTVDRMNDYPLFIQKNGFTFALLNYTYGTNGIAVTKPNVVNLIDTAVMRRDIITAKAANPDFIIVFTHWGQEYQSQPSSIQKKITELCFKWGVQLVIGSHPHVLQPMEWRKPNNQLVTYSLGNFVSGQRDRYKDGGAMLQVEFMKITTDSVSTTMIDSAGYILEWVYRTVDDKKDYYVLPVPTFENDTTGFIKDEASRLAFKTFADDSRKLLNKYNLNLYEIVKQPVKNPEEQPASGSKEER